MQRASDARLSRIAPGIAFECAVAVWRKHTGDRKHSDRRGRELYAGMDWIMRMGLAEIVAHLERSNSQPSVLRLLEVRVLSDFAQRHKRSLPRDLAGRIMALSKIASYSRSKSSAPPARLEEDIVRRQ